MISNRSLNKEEKELFNKNPSYGRTTIKLALKAIFEERIRYLDDGEDGGNSNAFLHAYWAALLAKNINEDWAKKWTTAHELGDITSLDSQIDLFNNSLGINFIKLNTSLTNDEIANAIEELIDVGNGKKIDDGKLINTTKENKRNLNIFESILEKALSLISKLIATSNDFRNADGMTPLIFATNKGEIEALKLIVKYSQIEAFDNSGETALFHAARLNNEEIGLFLLNNKANPNFVNSKNGNTPLMDAVFYKNKEFAKSLINFGANINLKDHEGYTAYDLAVLEEVESEFTFLRPS